jgi:hypothetical protein
VEGQIEVRFRDGTVHQGERSRWRWTHLRDGSDIVAYRTLPNSKGILDSCPESQDDSPGKTHYADDATIQHIADLEAEVKRIRQIAERIIHPTGTTSLMMRAYRALAIEELAAALKEAER